MHNLCTLRTSGFVILLLIVLVLVGYRQSIFATDIAKQSTALQTIALNKAYDLHGIMEYVSVEQEEVLIRIQERTVAHFELPFARKVHREKLQLRFRRLQNVRHISVHFGLVGEPFSESRRAVINTGIPGSRRSTPLYHVRLPNGDHDRFRVSFESRGGAGEAILESIAVQPLEPRDGNVWVYVIAVGLAFLILLPGSLLYVILHGSRSSSAGFQVSIFAYSLLFYVVNYIFLVGALKLSSTYAHLALFVCYVFLLATLAKIVHSKSEWASLVAMVRNSWQELTAFTLLLLVLCFALTYDANLPLENLFYTHISGPKTFDAFRAHDNMFQYVNGIAIANDEPFEKYYGNRQLMYRVEDREILPGLVYAVFRALLSPFSDTLENSYLVYTLLGIIMNLMILFPAAAIAKRYLGINSALLFVIVFSANACMLGNYLITWFKIAAGALFLSGLYCMLEERASTRGWVQSGLYFGLAANMHAGSALGLPLFVIWGALRHFRYQDRLSVSAFLGPVLLVIVFAAVITPWAAVKRAYLNDDYVLIETHFLGGYSSPEGLGASARLFLDSTTPQEQVSTRFNQLKVATRVTEITELQRVLSTQGVNRFLKQWDQMELNYLAILFYPMFLLVLLNWICRTGLGAQTTAHWMIDVPTSRTMLLISLLTMMILILAHYGRHPPDITYFQPMGVLALAYIVLIGFIWHSNRFIRAVYFAYVTFAAYRLAIFL